MKTHSHHTKDGSRSQSRFLTRKTRLFINRQDTATPKWQKTVSSCQPNGQRPLLLSNCNNDIIKKYKTTPTGLYANAQNRIRSFAEVTAGP